MIDISQSHLPSVVYKSNASVDHQIPTFSLVTALSTSISGWEEMVDKFVGHLSCIVFMNVWLPLTYCWNIYNSGWHGRWLAKNLFPACWTLYNPLLNCGFSFNSVVSIWVWVLTCSVLKFYSLYHTTLSMLWSFVNCRFHHSWFVPDSLDISFTKR